MSSGEVAAWAGVVVTVSAVIVALFKEDLVGIWRHPKLNARISLAPPDCHKTELFLSYQGVAPTFSNVPCYYLRIWVENQGNQRATQVQVFVSRLTKKQADGTFRELTSFLPMNLRWSHSQSRPGGPEIFAVGINPNMGKHCDLGFIVEPSMTDKFGHDLPSVPSEKTILALDLEVKPNTKSHLLPPGVYQIELKIAAANASPVGKTIEINHTGEWHDNQDKMFSDGIGMREIT